MHVQSLSCVQLCDPMDCDPTGLLCSQNSAGKNTVVGCHALLQRIFLFQELTQVSHIAGRFLTVWATREAQ